MYLEIWSILLCRGSVVQSVSFRLCKQVSLSCALIFTVYSLRVVSSLIPSVGFSLFDWHFISILTPVGGLLSVRGQKAKLFPDSLTARIWWQVRFTSLIAFTKVLKGRERTCRPGRPHYTSFTLLLEIILRNMSIFCSSALVSSIRGDGFQGLPGPVF